MFSQVASSTTGSMHPYSGSGDAGSAKISGDRSQHSKSDSSKPSYSTSLQLSMSRFKIIADAHEKLKDWLRKRIDSLDSKSALHDPELRKARIEFVLLTSKAIRKDPKLGKTKYEEILWKTTFYPLVRVVSEDANLLQSADSRLAFQDLLRLGYSAFTCLIQEFLMRLKLPFSGIKDLPMLCEVSLGEKKANQEYVSWVRSFLFRCLCSVGDLYRYSTSLDPRSRFLAARYYEMAAQTRPSDGRAISCLGLLQKDQGEVFSAMYFFLLSACKKVRYEPFRQNVDSVHQIICDLYLTLNDNQDRSLPDNPQETIKSFSITILHIVQGILSVEDKVDSGNGVQFTRALDLLSECLKFPVPVNGEWREVHFSSPAYLHPDLLTKICVILLSMRYVTETEGDKSGRCSSFYAFIITVVAQIFACVEHSIRYWLDYTGFRLIPQPDPAILCRELHDLRNVEDRTSSVIPDSAHVELAGEEDFDSDEVTLGANTIEPKSLDHDGLDSVEDFWRKISLDFERVNSEPEKAIRTHSPSSYIQAFRGFVDTQPYLPLVHLLFQFIRCDHDTLIFCTTHFPNIFCNIVDIVNLLHIPQFVRTYVEQENVGLFPLRDEVLFREYMPLEKWVSTLDWTAFYRRNDFSPLETQILLFHRFQGVVQWLDRSKLAFFDKGQQKWICTLERRFLSAQVNTDSNRKLIMAQRLGKAWRAEEDVKEEKEFMSRRADLPRYLVIDTSCFVRKLDWVKRLYESKIFKFVIPAYVLEELDKGKSNKAHRDAIRFLDATTVAQDLDRVEIQKWKNMHKHDVELESDWKKLTATERSVRVMVDCAKFFSEEVRRKTDDNPEYGLHIRVITDLDLQSVYCARVMEQMEKLEMPHEMKLMRIHDLMGWLNEGPQYFRRLQEAEREF